MGFQISSALSESRKVTIVVLATAVFALALAVQSPVHADDPVGDCFGGALSDDPLHCYVLQDAHNAAIIEIDGIYVASRGLFIYLTQDDSLDDQDLAYLRQKTQEEARRIGKYDCVFDPYGCGSGVLSIGTGYILPESSVYQDIQFFPGGADTRQTQVGWQAFRELWPGSGAGAGGSSGSSGAEGFDVSGVDVTNFPVLRGNCGDIMASNSTYDSCLMWERNPSIAIAGWQSTDKAYVQVKIPNGDETQIAVAKNAVIQSKRQGLTEDNVEIIPVNHDYEELWRWSIILDRFARSSGNTLGITTARLGFNTNRYAGDPALVWPLDDVQEAHDNRAGWRTIIHLETLHVKGTADELPRLLRQLSIPTDAVGLIVEKVYTPPERVTPEQGQQSSPGIGSNDIVSIGDPTEESAVTRNGWSTHVVVPSVALGLVVLMIAGFFLIRLRRMANH